MKKTLDFEFIHVNIANVIYIIYKIQINIHHLTKASQHAQEAR